VLGTVPIHVVEGFDESGDTTQRLGSRWAGSLLLGVRPKLLAEQKRLAQTDNFDVQSTLDQFHDLLVWGLVCVIVVCFVVAVWSVYKNSRGRTRPLSGQRRVGE
jgi:hypothetical protein